MANLGSHATFLAANFTSPFPRLLRTQILTPLAYLSDTAWQITERTQQSNTSAAGTKRVVAREDDESRYVTATSRQTRQSHFVRESTMHSGRTVCERNTGIRLLELGE